MKKIIVIGNSPAGVKACELIRQNDQSCDITLFSLDGTYPSVRQLFPGLIGKSIKEDKALYHPVNFYKDNKINVILERKLSKINFKKKKVNTEEKDQLDYDVLLITSTGETQWPDIKGTARIGVFALNGITDVKNIMSHLSLTDTVLVQTNSVLGLQTAVSLQKQGKEVILIIPSQWPLDQLVDQQMAEIIVHGLGERGLRMITDNSITEILGDTETKAVRLKNGKVLATQMVIFSDLGHGLKMFQNSELSLDQGIRVNENFRTNVEDVYALGEIACINNLPARYGHLNLQQLEREGLIVSRLITNQGNALESTITTTSFTLGDLSVHVLGQYRIDPDIKQFLIEHPQEKTSPTNHSRKVFKKIFIKNDTLSQAVLINADQDFEQCYQLIKNQSNINSFLDQNAVAVNWSTEQNFVTNNISDPLLDSSSALNR